MTTVTAMAGERWREAWAGAVGRGPLAAAILPARGWMRIAIVANEFFDAEINRVGGFGWAARRSAQLLSQAGHEVVFLTGEVADVREVGGYRLIPWARARTYTRLVRAERFEAFLSVDYRPGYLPALLASPRTPLVIWARDPRDPQCLARLATLTIPGHSGPVGGLRPIDTRGAGWVVRTGSWMRRRVAVASPAPSLLRKRTAAAYGLPDRELALLPNPIECQENSDVRSASPRVLSLGRFDPVKRPWLVLELARRMPEVEFVLAGSAFVGTGGWRLGDLPSNARMVGNVSGEEKHELIASSWVLVNTSLHEGLPVSFLEALSHGVPVVAGVDAEGVPERFGIQTEVTLGDGLAGLDDTERALRELIEDEPHRRALGEAGREWVRNTHSPERFQQTFERLVGRGQD